MGHGGIAGRYTLEREIGRGGMGAVWLAHDDVLGRQVAIKRVGMFPGGGSPDLVRAEREARLAAKLNHPHVVAVFDFVTEGQSQWLVMEYVEGTTLAELSRSRGGLAPDEAAPIIRQAAEALAAAHAAGIVHRDVKPSNILVSADGAAKLTDFGIARARADATLTQTGMVTGSPAYLAPEVASGRTATEASDVWSLGATLYQALTGRPPYDVGDNVMGALYKIVNERPPRAANAGWLAPLLDSTMTMPPEQRWSMAQVRDFLHGVPVQPVTTAAVPAPEVPTTIAPNPLPPRPPSRSPLALVAAVLAIVALTAGGWMLGRGGSGTPAAETPDSPTATEPATSAAAPTEAGMVTFVEDYLRLVTADPEAAFQRLTTDFQEQSGGLETYRRFWEPIRSATPSDIDADPETLEVRYRVEYDGPNNRPADDRVRLRLVFEDGRYLIAGEDD